MKIVGYGICAPGETKRYMKRTLEEFKRLCDDTIILINANTKKECEPEIAMLEQYGFKWTLDGRIWGVNQWKIKQDFLENNVAKLNPDFCVCLDMDEVLSATCTREWIEKADLDAYHVFVVDLWNDDDHYKPESCFWNVRLWRWNGDTKFKQKPVHCGLAPQWAYYYHRHAPFLLKHYGLMRKEDREKKVRRYEKYDPNAQHMDQVYYDMLRSDTAKPFIESELLNKIQREVSTYKQLKPKIKMEQKKVRYAYVENPHGVVVDIPEKDLAITMKRKGFRFVGWADDAQKEMEELFNEPVGSYQGTTETIQEQEKEAQNAHLKTPEEDMASTTDANKDHDVTGSSEKSRAGFKEQKIKGAKK